MQNAIDKTRASQTRPYRQQSRYTFLPLGYHRAAAKWQAALMLAAFLAVPALLVAADNPAAPQTKQPAADRGVRGAKPAVPRKPRPKLDRAAQQAAAAAARAMAAMTPTSTQGTFLLLDLSDEANESFAKPIGKGPVQVGKVPFQLPQKDRDNLSLRQAGQWGCEMDFPWSHESPSPSKAHDPGMPVLKVPVADYVAAHVLAVADDDPQEAPAFTLRMGTVPRGGNLQCLQRDFAGQVPRQGELAKVDPTAVVKTAGQNLCYVRVPMTFAFAQDLLPAPVRYPTTYMAIEVTKEVRLARRSPDPARYRYRPLGLPSGVHIAAITLEKSPLQMQVHGAEVANAFAEPQTPTFRVSLANITPAVQNYSLTFEAVSLAGVKTEARRSGRVEPGKTADVSVPLAVGKRGYYDLRVTLADGAGHEMLRRETSFALMPPDTRKHRAQSPFGTYDFGGTHYTCPDYDQTGPLYVKLGMRYGFFSMGASAARRKYGLVKGNEPSILNRRAPYDAVLAGNPDLPPMALIFHENTVSERNTSRVPDVFTNRPPYVLNQDEEARLKSMVDPAISAAKEMREKHPEVKLALGNDALPAKEEFLRHKFPAELFDSLGNESGSFSHPPECQPPDWLGNNSSLWMDRQLLDAYGYQDKFVSQCHEVCYPSTNPGNLSYQTQADYFVRHAMHSLAWGVPAFRPGVIMDVGGNYRWGEWGSAGYCHSYPEMNVKPSFVAFATMTSMLDGAKFVSDVPLGSPALYAAEFARPDGSQVFVLWTLRGQRPVTLSVAGSTSWRLVDGQANESELAAPHGKVNLTLTPAPVYLIGKGQLTAGKAGQPVYDDKPDGRVSPLAALDSLDDWTMETAPSTELEYYDFQTPRRKGNFIFEAAPEFEGRSGVIRVSPQPIAGVKATEAMPMYAVLVHKRGIPVPGTPTEIGLWINGNAGWGRVIFDLTDASGQRWISIGANMDKYQRVEGGGPKRVKVDPATFYSPDVLAKFPSPGISDWNTEDAWGLSRINFDGWRYVAFPLPGNYPGEHYGWPANSQWRGDKDGVVHYPLVLKKLVVELNAKVLHMKTFAPVPRPEIYLKDLIVAEGDTLKVKRVAGDYDPADQMK